MAGIPYITPYPMPDVGELPENTAQWSIDPDRAVLLLHDMQHFFLRAFPRGEAPVTDLLRNARALRERCAALGVPVAYTAQPGGMTEEQRGLLKDFWGPGMTTDEDQRRVVDEVAPGPGDLVLTKWRYSAFHRSPLLRWLRDRGRDQLIIAGVYAHVGILMTANDAFTQDVQPFLVADAIADFTAEEHHLALRYVARRCGVVTTAKQLLADLPQEART
ncbi:isochorismatase family protein [Planobispora takensis]|uniref:Putative isochorismatase (Phenazine biosynthesis) PhzD n=1 Tax=Planobispora takensis TaxID=1367882 RepID=A0A8J3WUI0_9ACTN|nr:isochorismatase family protein [Planobispora takensis]GII02125.1 putative isochorismatase (phenazine biosynthesis) PhzD [Planobispora takensis]